MLPEKRRSSSSAVKYNAGTWIYTRRQKTQWENVAVHLFLLIKRRMCTVVSSTSEPAVIVLRNPFVYAAANSLVEITSRDILTRKELEYPVAVAKQIPLQVCARSNILASAGPLLMCNQWRRPRGSFVGYDVLVFISSKWTCLSAQNEGGQPHLL